MVSTFPRPIRQARIGDYPANVRRDLADRGLAMVGGRDILTGAPLMVPGHAKASATDRLLGIGCGLLFMFALFCTIIGFIVIIRTFGGWVF